MEEYGGLFGAYQYAVRRSRSWLFRSYAAVSALVGLFVAVLLGFAVVAWVANPTGVLGERALLGVVAILVLVPLAAPVMVVARRHRRGTASRRGDRWLAAAGYGFIGALYVGLLITDPTDHAVSGPLAPAVAALDSLPPSYGAVPPLLAVVLLVVAIRGTRADG